MEQWQLVTEAQNRYRRTEHLEEKMSGLNLSDDVGVLLSLALLLLNFSLRHREMTGKSQAPRRAAAAGKRVLAHPPRATGYCRL
jgi:hypothetical protein